MFYNMPLYRPPSEAESLIIQVTLGCSHNKCTFCDMYKSKKFKIKSLEQIKFEIDSYRQNYSNVNKIFLADGDALIIKFETLKEILTYLGKKFPECKKITLYGSPSSINLKTLEELKELKNLKLYMVYMGIESGDDAVLVNIKKGNTSEEIKKAGIKIIQSGLKLSVTVIAGLGGKENTENHIINTAKIINNISPTYFSILSLLYNENTEIYEDILNKKFIPLNSMEILEEIKQIICSINTEKEVIFRANHASNYLLLGGILPKDKKEIIKRINDFLKDWKNNEEQIYRNL